MIRTLRPHPLPPDQLARLHLAAGSAPQHPRWPGSKLAVRPVAPPAGSIASAAALDPSATVAAAGPASTAAASATWRSAAVAIARRAGRPCWASAAAEAGHSSASGRHRLLRPSPGRCQAGFGAFGSKHPSTP